MSGKRCPNCKSSIVICPECGKKYAHGLQAHCQRGKQYASTHIYQGENMDNDGTGYNYTLDADEQITAEEMIASTIFEYAGAAGYASGENSAYSEDDCAQLGRDILRQVLRQFRPDLFDDYKGKA